MHHVQYPTTQSVGPMYKSELNPQAAIMIQAIQIFLLILSLFPVFHWIRCKIAMKHWQESGNKKSEGEITILLPMRDEQFHAERKITETVEEIKSSPNTRLVIIDSFSSDKTAEISRRVLNNSDLGNNRWEVISTEKPGKSHAINVALSETKSDIYIMMDADTRALEGWLGKILSNLSNPEVAVISGIEQIRNKSSNKNRVRYRAASDTIRLWESFYDSTIVLEGALIAWKSASLPNLRINERSNADDAQIAIAAIRRGFRSVTVPDLNFIDMNYGTNWTSRSIRRSQGLSRAIMSNLDLFFSPISKGTRKMIFHSLLLYIVFPWSFISLMVISIIEIAMDPYHSQASLLILSGAISLAIFTSVGKSVIWGSLISIRAHIQLATGKTYSSWETGRNFENH